jgi:hypothetical protein
MFDFDPESILKPKLSARCSFTSKMPGTPPSFLLTVKGM